MKKAVIMNVQNVFMIIGIILIIFISQYNPVLAGFNEEAQGYFQTHIVPYLKGFSLLSLVAAAFLIVAGKPEGTSWAVKVLIGLGIAINAERIIQGIWSTFA